MGIEQSAERRRAIQTQLRFPSIIVIGGQSLTSGETAIFPKSPIFTSVQSSRGYYLEGSRIRA